MAGKLLRWLIQAASALLMITASASPAQTPPSPAAARAQLAAADRARLAEVIAQSLKPLSLANGKLEGAGGAWLATRLRDTDFLMIGETHGSGGIAQVAGLLVDALPTDRPLAYVTEIGPTGAAIQEPLLRGPADALERYMADPRRAISFPFLNLREEAALARKVLARAEKRQGALWGLDQEFAPSTPLLLDRLDSWARSPAQKAAVAAMRAQSGSLMAMAGFPDSLYDRLETAFAKGPDPARRLIADMRLSTEIYRLQESAGNVSNRMREDTMKRNFLAHWRAAGKQPPRLVLKFGAYHLTAGLSPTQTPALGSFINALALMEGRTSFSIMIVCGPDGEQIDFRGAVAGCRKDFEASAGLFFPYLATDGPALIDTAPLRLIPGTLRRQGVNEDIRNYINSYDAILILKGVKAATPFARPLPSFFEGL